MSLNALSKSRIASLLTTLLAATTCAAGDWSPKSCPADPEPIARELIQLELAGGQLNEKSDCIDQSRFSYVIAQNEGSYEQENTTDVRLKKGDSFKITKIEKTDEFGEYLVHFTIRTEQGKKAIEHQDTILFAVHTNEKKRKLRGCASQLKGPDKIYVREECIPKKR